MKYAQELAAAKDAARGAAAIIRRYYQANVAVTTKADRTPVTVADVESEKHIRAVLNEAFPGDGFYGEETGRSDNDSNRLWLVDPIDGTRSFVREYPFFSTQIALMVDGELVVGVSSAPEFDELAWAVAGQGAWLNDQPIRVSSIDVLEDSALSTGNLKTLANSPTRWAAYAQLVKAVARIRGYGDFYHYHLLASGKIEAIVESDVNILDIAALTVIVREAGGIITDLDGEAVCLDTTSVLAGNVAHHDELRRRFNP